MERMNFTARYKALMAECAKASVELFKEYGITRLFVPDDIESINMSHCCDPDEIRVIELDDPNSKYIYEYFYFHTDNGEEFSAGDLYDVFDWPGLYDTIVDTIEFYLNNNVPASEWGKNADNEECL